MSEFFKLLFHQLWNSEKSYEMSRLWMNVSLELYKRDYQKLSNFQTIKWPIFNESANSQMDWQSMKYRRQFPVFEVWKNLYKKKEKSTIVNLEIGDNILIRKPTNSIFFLWHKLACYMLQLKIKLLHLLIDSKLTGHLQKDL